MNADIHELYRSPDFRVLDFLCRCTDRHTSGREYTDALNIVCIRKGNFLFNVFRNSLDAHNGKWLISKPGYEHTVSHVHEIPDECTILEIPGESYQHLFEEYHLHRHWFFGNPDLHSIAVPAEVESEYLHHVVCWHLNRPSPDPAHVETLVLEMLDKVVQGLSEKKSVPPLPVRKKKNHLITIERAKSFMNENFDRNLSLDEIARHCYVSPFHFSRVFKTFTHSSPHEYLLKTRIKHSELLLRHTNRSVTEIGFSSGFNSLEHFIAAFKQSYALPPASFRKTFSKTSKIS